MDRLHDTHSALAPADPHGDARDDCAARSGRRMRSHGGETEESIAGLAAAVEQEIVPRLVQGHRIAATQDAAPEALRRVDAADVEEFARIVLTADIAAVEAFVAMLRARPIGLEAIYMDLLEPTARRLGVMWDEDLCDFADVTLGMGRLQQVLRALGSEFRRELECAQHGRRLLLIPAPGEQHTFGLLIVADFFARDGWEVRGCDAVGNGAFRAVREEWFDVVGLSAGCAGRLDVLAADIRAIRAASRNPAVGVLVGGPVFIAHPEYAARVGADGMAVDGRQAPGAADEVLAMLARRSQ